MKKYAVILCAIAVVVFMAITLVGNKQKLDNELKTMQEYTSIVPIEVINPRILQAKKIVEENGALKAKAEISVLSETTGKVLSVSFGVGDHVRAGQLLAGVEKEVIESQYTLAKTNLENAEKDLVRNGNLAKGDAITQQQMEASTMAYQNAKANFAALKKQLENTEIRSPIDGIISSRSIEKGASLTPSMPLFSIVEQDRMVFTVKIAETDLTGIIKGRPAAIRFDAISQTSFIGIVRSIGVVPDLSGRYDVDLDVENHSQKLRAGMNGTAVFEIVTQDSGLVIPRKCIVGSVKEATVFIQNGDSVTLRAITAQPLNETDVLVENGVSIQEKIVISGQINLRSGSKVKVMAASTGLATEGEAGH
jgi:membrane fusion protein, multidrug efflux system